MAEDDRDRLLALHEGADTDALRLRFFAVGKSAGRDYVEHVLSAGTTTIACLVSTVAGEIVGLATAERRTPDTAEIAFLVAQEERGHGLGTLLLEHLAAVCRELGVERLVADVLPENRRMIEVFRDAGYTLQRHSESGLLVFELSTDASATTRSTAEARRRGGAEARR